MPKSLHELNLTDEALPTAGEALDALPHFGEYAPLPPPGIYRFKLPTDMLNRYDTLEAHWVKSAAKTRVACIFDEVSPLLIVQARDPHLVGTSFQTRLTNAEMERGRRGSGQMASDLDYLGAAFGVATKPAGNRGYVEMCKRLQGEFTAEVVWTWHCNKERSIRVEVRQPDGSTTIQEYPEQKGCGLRYKQADKTNDRAKKVDRENGLYPLEFVCSCGNVLRPFANLDNIRA